MKLPDRLVTFVTQMLEAKEQEAGAVQQGKQDFWAWKSAALDGQIDTLVYALYGLTAEEIALVEGTAPPAGKEADDE